MIVYLSTLWIARLLVKRAGWEALKQNPVISQEVVPSLTSSPQLQLLNLLLSEEVNEFQFKFKVRADFQIKRRFICAIFSPFFLFLLEGEFSLFLKRNIFLEKSCTVGATYLGHLSLLLPSSFFSPPVLSLSGKIFFGNSNNFFLLSL